MMKQKIHISGGRATMLALAVSVCISLGCAALAAWLIISGSLPETAMAACSYVVVYISALVGAVLAARGGDNYIAVRITILGLLYFLLLLGTGILLMDGRLTNIWANVLSILLGCGTACAICIMKGKTGRRRKKAIW